MRSFSHKKLIIEIIFRSIMNTFNLKYLYVLNFINVSNYNLYKLIKFVLVDIIISTYNFNLIDILHFCYFNSNYRIIFNFKSI